MPSVRRILQTCNQRRSIQRCEVVDKQAHRFSQHRKRRLGLDRRDSERNDSVLEFRTRRLHHHRSACRSIAHHQGRVGWIAHETGAVPQIHEQVGGSCSRLAHRVVRESRDGVVRSGYSNAIGIGSFNRFDRGLLSGDAKQERHLIRIRCSRLVRMSRLSNDQTSQEKS